MPKKEKTFEEALDRLQEIVSVLEDNEKPLDETVRLFEEGLQLVQLCDERLKKFETQIEELSEKHADESKADWEGSGRSLKRRTGQPRQGSDGICAACRRQENPAAVPVCRFNRLWRAGRGRHGAGLRFGNDSHLFPDSR